MVALERLEVNTRLVVEAVDEARRHDLHKVRVALVIFREQHEVVVAVLALSDLTVKAGAAREIDLAAEDRLDALFQRLLIEVDDTVHHTVVGDRHRIHPELPAARDHLRDPTGTIEKTVACMNM